MKAIFDKFGSLNVLIIGDVMMDSYIWGKVDRISPEAPVPVISVSRKENRLGGAANVALNVQSLGANPVICAIVGHDSEGQSLLGLMHASGLDTGGILEVPGRQTTVKTRVIAHHQHIVRVDAENEEPVDEATTTRLMERVRYYVENGHINAIIFEDYDKGLITPALISEVVALARENGIITVVDPKKRNFHSYNGVTLFKPNLKELREGLKSDLDPAALDEVEEAVGRLKSALDADAVMLTLSEHGVFIDSKEGRELFPAHVRKIADVSGAGDTVVATVAVCLASGMSFAKSAALANLAGGLVCEHVGVVPVDKNRLLEEADYLLRMASTGSRRAAI